MDRDFNRLLEKFIRKECTPEEAKKVLLWMQDQKNASDLGQYMDSFWNEITAGSQESIPFKDNWSLLENELVKRSQNEGARRGFRAWAWTVSIAATLTILLAAIVFLQKPEREYIQPGIAADQMKSNMVRLANKGEKNTFYLTDGTKIILNSDSRLEIDGRYGVSSRKVSLDGEAYFEVARNDSLPFQVYAGGLVTTALGTSFNIRTRDGEDVAVSLTSGKVAIELDAAATAKTESSILNPGEEVIYQKDAQVLQKRKFDVRKVTGWKDGVMIMDEANVEEVKKILENWYDIKIKFINYPEVDWTFSGEFRNESLNDVLKGLQYSKGIRYEIKEDQVIIGF